MKLGYVLCAVSGLVVGAILVGLDYAEKQAAAARAYIETHHCVEVSESPRGVWKRGAWRCDKGLTAITEIP